MDYFKNLTVRQWAIILLIIVLLVAAFYLFINQPVDNEKVDIERLLNQGTAPLTSEENIGHDKLEKFLNPESSRPGASSTIKQPSDEEKNALFKLMSAPKSK